MEESSAAQTVAEFSFSRTGKLMKSTITKKDYQEMLYSKS